MASKRIGIVLSEELYRVLKSFSDSESETITQTITTAIKERINKRPVTSTIEYPIIPKVEELIWLSEIERIPTTPTTLSNSWENILDLFDYDQSISIMTEEEFPKVKEYLFTLSEQELQLLWRKCSSHMFEVWENSPLIINFIDWAKEKLST